MMNKKQTADEAYRAAHERVSGLVKDVQKHIATHARRQAADTKNWGFVGDMNRYAELLEELLGRRG